MPACGTPPELSAALSGHSDRLGGAGATRTATTVLLVFLGCYAGAALGLRIRLPETGAALLFPPYAVLTAALLVSPVRVWWLLLIAAAAGNFVPHQVFERSLSFVALAEVANASRALVAAGGAIWLAGRSSPFRTFRDMTVFLVFGGLLGPLLGAVLGAADVVLHNPGADFWQVWGAWFVSNMVTGVTLLPLLVVLATNPLDGLRSTPRRWIEGALVLAAFLAVTTVLTGPRSRSAAALLYGPLPFLIWAVVRFGPAGTVAMLAAFLTVTIRAALPGRGLFAGAFPEEALLEPQLILVAVSVPMLLLAALIQEHARVTGALKESREQYRSVVEDQTELICRFLADGTYTFVNEAYCRYFQRSREQLLGRTFWEFIPDRDQEPLRAKLASITVHNPVSSYEHRVLAPGGEVRWQHWTDRGFFDPSGRILELQSVGRDVTDRRLAEEALREKEERLALAVRSAELGIWDWNLAAGTATWSEEMCTIFGRQGAHSESPLEDLLRTVHPADREWLHQAFQESLRRIAPLDAHFRVLHPDGSERWGAVTGRTYPDGEGRAHRFVALTRDITARKRAEGDIRRLEREKEIQQAQLAAEEGFRSLADNAPVLIWRSGLENEGVYFNKTWLEFTGRALEQELGLGWIDAVHPEDRESAREICDAAFRRREPFSMHFRLRRCDGEYRWLLDRGVPYLGADGVFTGYVGSCVDITERHLAEEALQEADRQKDEFLAMLGHELRNPLAPIGAAVEILRRTSPADPSVTWAREAISRQLRQLTHLVDDLVDVSRIVRNRIDLNVGPLDFVRVVHEAVEASRPLIDARDHRLSITIMSEALPIRGDLVRLVQVVSNLLNNAAKFTERGGRIAVSIEREGSIAVLKVLDSGVGIPHHMLERVFDMFTQGSERDRSLGGLGIGLTLAKRLVEVHGGSIEAYSAGPNRGSEFTVRLPLAPELGLPDPARDSFAVGGGPAPGRERRARRRILIVDDNVDAAEGLSRVLGDQQHEIRVVHDGFEALNEAERLLPDIVLLDIGLPEMDGLEVARRLRARAKGQGPYLVAMTGFAQTEALTRAAEAGFDEHLTKPFDVERLQSILERVAAPGSSRDPFRDGLRGAGILSDP